MQTVTESANGDAVKIKVVRAKEGVVFKTIAPAGFRILSAISRVSELLGVDLTITSACDGLHSGPDDPHFRGEAFDVRSQDLDEKMKPVVLNAIRAILPAANFYCFLESPLTKNEHFHCQIKKGTTYP